LRDALAHTNSLDPTRPDLRPQSSHLGGVAMPEAPTSIVLHP
jgi:hypothetical protein